MKICFATNNANKVREIKNLLHKDIEILLLKEIGCEEDLTEDQETLEGNSLQKASYVYDKYGIACFADDTGLEVEALNGAPGVYSARYAGPQRDNDANIKLLLKNMIGQENRRARFRTVITMIMDGRQNQFEGIVEGEIITELIGKEGFGYDSIFKPSGYSTTFAEMSIEEKNMISHRGRAIRKLITHMQSM